MDAHPSTGAQPASGTPTYEIRVGGHLDGRWTQAFPELALRHLVDADGRSLTVLRGPVTDEAALHGLLARIRDLGIPLVGLARQPDPEPPSEPGDAD